MMNYLLKLSILLVLGMTVVSCSDSLSDDNDVQVDNYLVDDDCYTPIFPVTYLLPDSTEITVDSIQELKLAIREWKEANPGVRGKTKIVFPIDLENEAGDIVTVNNYQELKMYACRKGPRGPRGPKGGKNSCVQVVYPVTIAFPDDTTLEIDSKKAGREAFKVWKEENPDTEGKPQLVFPIEVSVDAGDPQMVDSIEDLQALKEACE